MRTRLLRWALCSGLVLGFYAVFSDTLPAKPDVTENYVYIKMPDGTYDLTLEPAMKSAAKALKLAYATTGAKELRRLMPRQLTGYITKKLGQKESTVDAQETAHKIASFFDDFGYVWNEQTSAWQPRDEQTGITMRAFGIDPNEWVIPADGFASYNDFFIKKLKPGSRPIASETNVLVAPADSKLTVIQDLSTKQGQSTFFNVKSKKFSLNTFLKNSDLAEEFDGGTLLIFRLSPYNYHRFHFPVNAVPIKSTTISGGFESVDPIAYKTGINPLIINVRHIVPLQTSYGRAVMVIVGAFGVGSIIESFQPGRLYAKGDEAGYFQYGGSTIAMVFTKGALIVDPVFLDHAGYETAVKMGERIGTLTSVAN